MKADEILEKIPQHAIDLYGIEVKEIVGNDFLFFQKTHVSVKCSSIKNMEVRDYEWVDIRTVDFSEISFSTNFDFLSILI